MSLLNQTIPNKPMIMDVRLRKHYLELAASGYCNEYRDGAGVFIVNSDDVYIFPELSTTKCISVNLRTGEVALIEIEEASQ